MPCWPKRARHRCTPAMTEIEVFAPAKVNLALHVTGQRADGYHTLDSLVAFAPLGDVLRLSPAEGLSLVLSGPEAAGLPAGPDNLVLRAAALMGPGPGARFALEKRLPAASGIGGGSADAAAALRGLAALRGQPLPGGIERLGADVPMCLHPRPARTRGIGEQISPVALPALPAVLVNPRQELSTPSVFKALQSKENPPLPEIPAFAGAAECIGWLAHQRNDLQAPALALAPVIGAVLAALAAQPGCLLARMSGSGATCFGLFATAAEAEAAGKALAAAQPGWWVGAGYLGDQTAAAEPRRP